MAFSSIKEDITRSEAAVTEARNEVIRLLGGVIAGCTNFSALPQRAVTEEVKQEEEPQDDDTISDYALSYLMDGMEE